MVYMMSWWHDYLMTWWHDDMDTWWHDEIMTCWHDDKLTRIHDDNFFTFQIYFKFYDTRSLTRIKSRDTRASKKKDKYWFWLYTYIPPCKHLSAFSSFNNKIVRWRSMWRAISSAFENDLARAAADGWSDQDEDVLRIWGYPPRVRTSSYSFTLPASLN